MPESSFIINKSTAIAVLFLCAALLLLAVAFSGMPLNHDCALLLQCGRLITEGSTPYIDHIETNVYMAQYIHVPPVLLSNSLNINVADVFIAGVSIFVLYSCFAVFLLVHRSGIFNSRISVLIVASSVLVFSMKAFCDGDFGQRAHLFLLAYLPFFFVRFSRYQDKRVSTPLSLITGFTMGVLMLCKPSFFLMVVLIEIWMNIRSGRKAGVLIKPEMLTLYAIVLMFIVHLLLLPGSLNSPFFTRWLPFIAGGYSSYNAAFYDMIRGPLKLWLILTGSIALAVFSLSRNGSAVRQLLESLIVAVVLGILLFFLQHKGWLYQLFPAIGFAAVLLSVVIMIMYEKCRSTLITGNLVGIALLFCPVIICLLYAGSSFQLAGLYYTDMDDYLELIETYSEPGERISFISTSVYPKYPTLVYADRLPGTRYMSAFPIALVYCGFVADDSAGFQYRLPDEWTDEERLFLMELGMDIQKNRPALVFIQATGDCQACPVGFRIDEYLISSGWLEEFMENYELLFIRNGYRTYELDPSFNSSQ